MIELASSMSMPVSAAADQAITRGDVEGVLIFLAAAAGSIVIVAVLVFAFSLYAKGFND